MSLDLVTILVALELRRYLATAFRFLGSSTNVHLRVFAYAANRCTNVLRTNPAFSLYACMWPVIWLRTVKGTMPPA